MVWWRKKSVQNLGLTGLAILGVYALVYFDVVSRARESYAEAEKYMDWSRNPEKKKAYFENKFEADKTKLDEELKKAKISEEDRRQSLDVLDFDKNFALEVSSLKYAYQWYKDTYELFSPPESKWVRLARVKAPQALELWKQELRSQKIPFEDYMFE